MTLPSALSSPNRAIDRWFTQPEPNAAGRMGLFRILFCIFYLWHLSDHFAEILSGMVPEHHLRTFLIEWIRPYPLPVWFLNLTEAALVGSLVILLIGYHSRLATLAVLVLGAIYEGWLISIDREHAAVLLTTYIPFFMLLSGRWGDTYSLDAFLARQKGRPVVDPTSDAWPHFLPARASLVVLAVLFLTSAVYKLTPGSTWPGQPDLMGNILLDKNVNLARQGWPINPLAPVIAARPWLYIPFQYSIILLEAGMVLVLVGKFRNLMLATALLFHALNDLALGVTFTAVLIVYLPFIDWQRLRERILPARLALPDRVPPPLLIAATFALAIAAAVSWNSPFSLRSVINLNGLLDWRTIWIPALPFILIWWFRSLRHLFRPGADQSARANEVLVHDT